MTEIERKAIASSSLATRRSVLRAGSIGLLGLGLPELGYLRAESTREPKAKSVIYIFLSGGLSQIDSFDMKPEAPEKYRGSFRPISTKTPGLQICEHLPLLAARSDKWAICRSLTHPYNEHSQGHMVMLSGRRDLPPGFDASKPRAEDWPSIAACGAKLLESRGALPPAMVLPERLVHRTGRVIPGQFSGKMGAGAEPWFIEASSFNAASYGAYPTFNFHHERGSEQRSNPAFAVPEISLPEEMTLGRLRRRADILRLVNAQQRALETAPPVTSYRRYHDLAIRLLADSKTRAAFDLSSADARTLDRYGRNSFGWSLLLARQLVEAGVQLVQVNLGNNETWDTHQKAFHNLEHYLFPPTDRAVSALLDDLGESGLLDDTLVVMASEFGRTPRIFSIGKGKLPGRDHWGAVQTVWFAGGGVAGGAVVGSSDATGGHPKDSPQTPESFAATIFDALGIPRDAHWEEKLGRPHPLYRADPIPGLVS